MANTHRVIKHFKGDGQQFKPGDEVDGSRFTQLEKLVSQRYLARVDDLGPGRPHGAGPTPDPKIAQNRAQEKAAGRPGGPADDVAPDSLVGDTGDKSSQELKAEQESAGHEPKARLRGKLAEDFPGRAKLEEADLGTYAKVRKELEKEKPFAEITGIGPKTIEQMRELFAGEAEGDDTEDDSADTANTSEPGDSTVPKAVNA